MQAKHIVRVAILCVVGFLAACAGDGSKSGSAAPASEVVNTVPGGYKLVWADEFDVDGLPNEAKWTYDIFRNSMGWFNKEMQYYALQRKENSRVEKGRLIIEARQESSEEFEDSMMQEYTSARLVTRGRVNWTYGYFEIRARIPCGQGIWPAIWLLGESADRRWPRNGEIDMMEHINNEPGVHMTFHTEAHNHVARTQVTTTARAAVCDGSFHTYQLHWTPNEMKLGMDGSYELTYPNEGKGIEQWPYESPQYLILNIAVGGDWPGKPNESTVFPARMEVDYVRVYQPK